MEIPAGVEVVHTHSGLRLAVDGIRPGSMRRIRTLQLSIAIAGVATLGLLGFDGSAWILWAFLSQALGPVLQDLWPLAHGVVEIDAVALGVFLDGAWTRVAWHGVTDVRLATDCVVEVETDRGVVRLPASSSPATAEWLVAVVDTLRTQRSSDPATLPRTLKRLLARAA